MGFDRFLPGSSLRVVQATPRQQVTSRASCGLPPLDCATERMSAPCPLCLRWEPEARWCCRDESGDESGERLHKSWCQCRCLPRRPGDSLLLPDHLALGRPGHHWRLHLHPFRTICHYHCGPHWKLCWIEYCCWSDRSKDHRTARTKRKQKSNDN